MVLFIQYFITDNCEILAIDIIFDTRKRMINKIHKNKKKVTVPYMNLGHFVFFSLNRNEKIILPLKKNRFLSFLLRIFHLKTATLNSPLRLAKLHKEHYAK